MALTFTWLGHSTILLNIDGKHVIIDPYLTENPLSPLKVTDLQVSYILLTHAHGDHVGDNQHGCAGDTIDLAQHTGATIVCNNEMALWFRTKGLKHVWDGNPGGTMRGDFLDVKLENAIHSSSFGDGSYGGHPVGLVISGGGSTIYHAGDTSLFGDMALIAEEGIDLAFLPIGDTYTMGIDDSIRAIKLLKPKYVVPIHYNTFPEIVQDVTRWADRVNRETNAQPIVLDPGLSHTLE
jgi:L-ascorbate metabolism protein UlaG (beta-lactamase superfamily)